MTLLVLPEKVPDEGPLGYRFRLATANLLTIQELKALEANGLVISDNTRWKNCATVSEQSFPTFVHRWSRFCPNCLLNRGSWMIGWEVLYADACAGCGHWLVDTCSSCGCRIPWKRCQLLVCPCGHLLSDECTRSAPVAVIQLSRALQSIASAQDPTDMPIFRGLSLSQCVRVVRLLGSYGNAQGRSVPQKILHVDTLTVSWPISSMAAEVLSTWPAGFNALAKGLQSNGEDQFKGKLSKTFGGFYFALYRGFKEVEFQFLRTTFENYLAEHWTGGMAKRNRRLDASVLKKMVWVPASEACGELGISRRRMMALMREGRLRVETRTTAKNRQFVVVNRSDVDDLKVTLKDGLNLESTANRLGLKKQRLLALLPFICPEARKLGDQGCPWSVPTEWVDGWQGLIQGNAEIENATAGIVSLAHLLRYWPWTDEQIGKLLVAIHGGTFETCGKFLNTPGIGSLALNVDSLRHWFSLVSVRAAGELTLPEVASRLEVKQEVIYSLARSGFVQVTLRTAGRRAEQRVSFSSLEAFEQKYVFGRDLARMFNRSPQAILQFFESEGVRPVAGPSIDGCRQILFERHAVSDKLDGSSLSPKHSTP